MSHSGPAAREKQHSVRQSLLLGCVVALLGAACGQRGPLYLPEREPAATPAAPAAAADAQGAAGEAGENGAEEKDAEEKDQ
jgi:predicted small lipoprotein YifL